MVAEWKQCEMKCKQEMVKAMNRGEDHVMCSELNVLTKHFKEELNTKGYDVSLRNTFWENQVHVGWGAKYKDPRPTQPTAPSVNF